MSFASLTAVTISTVTLVIGLSGIAIPVFLLCAVVAPVTAMLLERVGLLDAFDDVVTLDLFDD